VTAGACGAPSCKKCSRRDNCAPTSASRPHRPRAAGGIRAAGARSTAASPAGAAAPGTPVSETGPACSCDARQYASAALKWSMIGAFLWPSATDPLMAVSTFPPPIPAAAEVSAPAELVQHWIGGRPASAPARACRCSIPPPAWWRVRCDGRRGGCARRGRERAGGVALVGGDTAGAPRAVLARFLALLNEQRDALAALITASTARCSATRRVK